MIYIDGIKNLIVQWQERAENSDNLQYSFAVSECTYELEDLLNQIFDEEAAAREQWMKKFAEEDDADSYLSSMESHERIA